MRRTSNFVALPDGRYLVRTQAGLKKAFKDHLERRNEFDLVETAWSAPSSYPAVVTFSGEWRQLKGHYVHVMSYVHANKYIDQATEAIRLIRESDEEQRRYCESKNTGVKTEL